ncbi:hypothetical protein GOODEAATRI_022557, partial [Goodea atripinnis]
CTIMLISKYLSQLDQLDHYSDNLARVVRKKGGAVGHKVKNIMAVIDQGWNRRSSAST